MTASAIKTTRSNGSLSIFQRTAIKDPSAVKDCISSYGKFIWALARKFTTSTEEAEAATLQIFRDIWRSAEAPDRPTKAETTLIAQIVLKRMIKHLG